MAGWRLGKRAADLPIAQRTRNICGVNRAAVGAQRRAPERYMWTWRSGWLSPRSNGRTAGARRRDGPFPFEQNISCSEMLLSAKRDGADEQQASPSVLRFRTFRFSYVTSLSIERLCIGAVASPRHTLRPGAHGSRPARVCPRFPVRAFSTPAAADKMLAATFTKQLRKGTSTWSRRARATAVDAPPSQHFE